MMKYATAEKVLAGLFNAGDEAQAKAFRGRLKHLKRLGIPLGSRPGKGKKIWYDDEHVFQWILCLELEECGIDPKDIATFIRQHWDKNMLAKFKGALTAYAQENDIYLYIRPHLMSRAWSSAVSLDYGWVSREEIELWGRRLQRRAILINISALANEMAILRVRADSVSARERGSNGND